MKRVVLVAVVTAACGRVGFDANARDAVPTDGSVETDASDAPLATACSSLTVLPVPTTGRVTGSLTRGTSTTEGTCGGELTDEVVYRLDVTQPGSRIQIAGDEGPGDEVVMYIRTDCDAPASELECDVRDGVGDGPLITRDAPVGSYFVFIDGQSSVDTGMFIATLNVMLPLGATCDPTNARDRCAPSLGCMNGTCQPESCDSAEVLGGNSPFVLVAKAFQERNLHGGSCGDGGDGGSRANEKIYRLDLASAIANLNVTTAGPDTDFDTLVYVRAGCTGPELACNDDDSTLDAVVDTGPLAAGTYFIFIDGFGPYSGTATVTITITP